MQNISKSRHVKHPFPPVISRHSRILILGSVPSVKSVEGNFYYMHPQNRFWKVMDALLGEQLYGAPVEERARVLDTHRIALYDAVEECDITGSSDSSITNVVPADIPKLISISDIGRIFANGAASYKYLMRYHRQLADITTALPSTSPANAACTLQELIRQWSVIKEYL